MGQFLPGKELEYFTPVKTLYLRHLKLGIASRQERRSQ
jgi:hypothetical protein